MTTLSEQARQLRNAVMRKYRKEHPDEIREYNRRYWERKALQVVTDKNTVTDISVTNVSGTKVPVTEGKKCLECGSIFESKRTDAIFCSPACRQKHYRNG